jgi:hypothetical protein
MTSISNWGEPYFPERKPRKTVKRLLLQEINRLTVENWQLRGALGYPVPSNIPETTEFKCGFCESRGLNKYGMGAKDTDPIKASS